MDDIFVYEAARAALQREGIEDATSEFPLADVDILTRWVVAVAVESAAKAKIADADIQAAATLGDLVELACGGGRRSADSRPAGDGSAGSRPSAGSRSSVGDHPSAVGGSSE